MLNHGIALCRVSTSKQRLEGSSLSAQEKRILLIAKEMFDCEIDNIWSLDISSRKGKNYKRKDLEEMIEYCKTHKQIKYFFVDEHDRFMRSVEEYYMWKLRFSYEAGVTLVIAAKPELTLNPNSASLAIEFFGIWQGEVSNEERITKTTDKMQAKIREGYYPGSAHTCYQITDIKGIHAPLEPSWSLMQTAMKRILYDNYSLHQALDWLQEQDFTKRGKGRLDMDRFKAILVDPYYAGIAKMKSWEDTGVGLHRAMISPDEHEQLKDIVAGVKKKFNKTNYNPSFQLSNIVECLECGELNRVKNRLVGYRNNNGRRLEVRKYYEWYRCRSCGAGFKKASLHDQLKDEIAPLKTSEPTRQELKAAMREIWKIKTGDSSQLAERLEQKKSILIQEKDNLVRSLGSNPEIAADIAESITNIKVEIKEVEKEISGASNVDMDFEAFVEFSLDYVDDLNTKWWDLTPDRRERCKQLVFPSGIFVDQNKRVSIPLISAIYRYESMKKEPQQALVYSNGGRAFRCFAPFSSRNAPLALYHR